MKLIRDLSESNAVELPLMLVAVVTDPSVDDVVDVAAGTNSWEVI